MNIDPTAARSDRIQVTVDTNSPLARPSLLEQPPAAGGGSLVLSMLIPDSSHLARTRGHIQERLMANPDTEGDVTFHIGRGTDVATRFVQSQLDYIATVATTMPPELFREQLQKALIWGITIGRYVDPLVVFGYRKQKAVQK